MSGGQKRPHKNDWQDPGSHYPETPLLVEFFHPIVFPFSSKSARSYEIQDMVTSWNACSQGSGNLISLLLLPPDGTLERSPAGPEKEEILGLIDGDGDDNKDANGDDNSLRLSGFNMMMNGQMVSFH